MDVQIIRLQDVDIKEGLIKIISPEKSILRALSQQALNLLQQIRLLGRSLTPTLIEALGKESTVLPLLKKQLSDVEKSIDNMLNAIQQGIFIKSTKERLEELEQQKSDLSVRIMQEEMVKPPIVKDKIVFCLTRFHKLDTTNLEHRKRLVDSFINAIYLFNDRIVFTFNYKDGSRTITFDDIENLDLCSDLTSLGAPKE